MSTRIALISDVHANLPAFEAFLADVTERNVDRIIHLGDLIAIGPLPRETYHKAVSIPNFISLRGNHDEYYSLGIPDPRPIFIEENEAEHHGWVRSKMGEDARNVIRFWPESIREEVEGITLICVHYPSAGDDSGYIPLNKTESPKIFDAAFPGVEGALICMGHNHPSMNIEGKNHYLNPGSLGCQREPLAPYLILDFRDGQYRIEHHQVSYSDEILEKAFSEQVIPASDVIKRIFFGNRF